jgi:hypothetical protein
MFRVATTRYLLPRYSREVAQTSSKVLPADFLAGEVLVPTGYRLIGQAAPFGSVSHERIGTSDPGIGPLGACGGPSPSPIRTFQLDLTENPAFFVGLEKVEDVTLPQ